MPERVLLERQVGAEAGEVRFMGRADRYFEVEVAAQYAPDRDGPELGAVVPVRIEWVTPNATGARVATCPPLRMRRALRAAGASPRTDGNPQTYGDPRTYGDPVTGLAPGALSDAEALVLSPPFAGPAPRERGTSRASVIPSRPGGAAGVAARMLLAVIASTFAAGSPFARADEIYVKGGLIEGRVLDESGDGVKLETPSGLLLVPRSAITRRVRGASRLEMYALERAKYQGTLQAHQHVELARWCREQRLSALSEQHLEAALSLDPQLPAALELAGYVRLGDLWLYTGPPVSPQAQRREADQVDKIVAALENGWYRRIRGLEDSYLSGKNPDRSFAAGRHQLLALEEPLVIRAACRAFGNAEVPLRVLLAQMLSGFEQDEAGLNLLLLVLFDPSAEVREAATLELTRREDERPARLLRLGLRCSGEDVPAALGRGVGDHASARRRRRSDRRPDRGRRHRASARASATAGRDPG